MRVRLNEERGSEAKERELCNWLSAVSNSVHRSRSIKMEKCHFALAVSVLLETLASLASGKWRGLGLDWIEFRSIFYGGTECIWCTLGVGRGRGGKQLFEGVCIF